MACGDEVGGGCRACGPGVVESCSGVTIARKEEVKGTMVDGGCGVTQGRVGVGGGMCSDDSVSVRGGCTSRFGDFWI